MQGFKGKPSEKGHFGAVFWRCIAFFDLEVEANIYMGQRYGMVLCLARAPPQVCAPTRHIGSTNIKILDQNCG